MPIRPSPPPGAAATPAAAPAVRPSPPARTADPYRDLAVIDERAPRFNQAVVGLLSLAAVLTGWWGLFAVLALQLTLGLAFGRRWCLPCVFYFELVQPRLGEGRLEDSRPPRFANQVGVVFLWSAALASAAGWRGLGLALGGTVAALALLASLTGFCAGCVLYRIAARLRGVRGGAIDRVDLAELCLDCQRLTVVSSPAAPARAAPPAAPAAAPPARAAPAAPSSAGTPR